MEIIDKIRSKAKENRRKIVLPEGEEPRTVQAAGIVAREGIAEVVLLGDPDRIAGLAGQLKTDLSKVRIVNPAKDAKLDHHVKTYYELRKHKGITEADAVKQVTDPMVYGIMLLHAGEVDGFLSGADHATGDTVRPALQIIKPAPGIGAISSFFIMAFPNPGIGENGLLIFADCAINIDPAPAKLAGIAIASARAAETLCGFKPRIAMLSFSTKGSARHPYVDRVVEATRIAQKQAPDLMIDGEIQADAALVAKVGEKKCPGSPVAGKANVLVFPDLNAANIGYKLVQRLAGAEAIGPILTGFRKPVNDLSRGCSVDDIVTMTAVTSIQTTMRI